MSEHVFNLNDEIICDHPVTAKTKRLWAVEMGCAAELRRICQKYNIKYFAGGGTLLGAVRHKGFIPWDDDMDFLMLKEDYDKFLSVVEKELTPPYVFTRSSGLLRIRNNNTTACTQIELNGARPPYNLGIFIDIFCLYALPDSIVERKMHLLQLRLLRKGRTGLRKLASCEQYGKTTWKDRLDPGVLACEMLKMFGIRDREQAIEYLNRLCSKYEGKNTRDVGITAFLPYNNRYIWKREIFEEQPVELPFENITVPAPKAYDEYLKTSFGDYTKFVKAAAQHSLPIMDPDRPASAYIEQIQRAQKESMSINDEL